ncbi:MAG TPA: adenylosuccinate lyase [Thermotogota bacterium]|nr:adenylosuccinate lyase [Thermotogota bacterium]
MIDRYALSPMKEIWTRQAGFERWLEVELAVVAAMEESGQAPAGTAEAIRHNATIDLEHIDRIEQQVQHDVIAFIRSVTQRMGDEARFFHKGLTSSDVVDSALSLALVRSAHILSRSLAQLQQALAQLAEKHRHTVTMGRTHGVHAEPTSFGLKFLGFFSETRRNSRRLAESSRQVGMAKISGAVGNYAHFPPALEESALEKLGLRAVEVSTQVVPRDIHAQFLSTLALIGTGVERIALEIRHLQRTEVAEAAEAFASGQRGSSAMPHKKNPIVCERLCGMARLLRGYAATGLENIALWHERDISHSSVERVVLPDACMLTYYMLEKIREVVQTLVIDPGKMRQNFAHSHGLVFSQKVLLALVEKGMSREQAYPLVQEVAMRARQAETDFLRELEGDPRIRRWLSPAEMTPLFDPNSFLCHVDSIFQRVLSPGNL